MTTSPFSTQYNAPTHDDAHPKQYFSKTSCDTKEKALCGRTILGSISQNSGRVQPFRAAKQVKVLCTNK